MQYFYDSIVWQHLGNLDLIKESNQMNDTVFLKSLPNKTVNIHYPHCLGFCNKFNQNYFWKADSWVYVNNVMNLKIRRMGLYKPTSTIPTARATPPTIFPLWFRNISNSNKQPWKTKKHDVVERICYHFSMLPKCLDISTSTRVLDHFGNLLNSLGL